MQKPTQRMVKLLHLGPITALLVDVQQQARNRFCEDPHATVGSGHLHRAMFRHQTSRQSRPKKSYSRS